MGFIPFASTFAGLWHGTVHDQIRQSVCLSEDQRQDRRDPRGCHRGRGRQRLAPDARGHLPHARPAAQCASSCPATTPRRWPPCVSWRAQRAPSSFASAGRSSRSSTPRTRAPFTSGKAHTVRQERTSACCLRPHGPCGPGSRGSFWPRSVSRRRSLTFRPSSPSMPMPWRPWPEKTGAILTAEEHSVYGGLGSTVCDTLRALPVPVHRVGVRDAFGFSGKPAELLGYFGLDAASIAEQARQLMETQGGLR